MKKEQIIKTLNSFIDSKFNELSGQSQLFMIFRPFVDKIINNNVNKLNTLLVLMEDDKGDIDIVPLLDKMLDNLITSSAKEYPEFLSGITIGEGSIKMYIPLINQCIVLNRKDIQELITAIKHG